MNRSMGLPDLYPFVLSSPAITKLTFVHTCIHTQAGRETDSNKGIRAMIAALRGRIATSTQS
jgi:hypothetical protein